MREREQENEMEGEQNDSDRKTGNGGFSLSIFVCIPSLYIPSTKTINKVKFEGHKKRVWEDRLF